MPFVTKIDDGAYRVMLERVHGNANPNMFLLNYDEQQLMVTDLVIVPKHFVTADLIEQRPPLRPTARRAGWIGCRIAIQGIPSTGLIRVVKSGVVQSRQSVLNQWHKTLFLRSQRDQKSKGWLVHIMRCIERIGRTEFSLDDVYGFEKKLSDAYPDNQHVKAKIRQKLQVLRDNGYLEFVGRGIYKLAVSS
ncbi:MAG TPA: DpnI domain-containing protein [Acetobacteraceae bacterium]|nr:DpnI domain-containing protein [Acetobacteraceae bacterium]